MSKLIFNSKRDMRELLNYGFEIIDGYPIQYKRKYYDLELNCNMYILVNSKDNKAYITKDTHLLYELKVDDEKYIDDLKKADLFIEEELNETNRTTNN